MRPSYYNPYRLPATLLFVVAVVINHLKRGKTSPKPIFFNHNSCYTTNRIIKNDTNRYMHNWRRPGRIICSF